MCNLQRVIRNKNPCTNVNEYTILVIEIHLCRSPVDIKWRCVLSQYIWNKYLKLIFIELIQLFHSEIKSDLFKENYAAPAKTT